MKKKILKYILSVSLLVSLFFIISNNSKNIKPITTDISEIKIITDDDYAPYSFRDESGYLKGLLIDEWNLWSIKTGVKVIIEGSSWQDSVNRMENDEYDVIETFYKTEDRMDKYNFSDPYAKAELQIFFQKDLPGIVDIESLNGFKVGVKKGDAYISLLKENGINDFIEFDKYEPLVESFKARKIDAFLMDKPPALYYLYKHNLQDEFKFTRVDYKNNLHRGIKKDDSELLRVVNIGFARISDAEHKQLQEKWFGSINPSYKFSTYMRILILTIVPLLLILSILNWRQKLVIKEKTIEIKKNEDKINAIVKSIPDLFFIIYKDGTFVDYHTNDINSFFYDPKDFLNKPIYELFNFNDIFIESLKKAIEQTLITEEIEILEYSLPHVEEPNYYEARIIKYNDDHVLAVIRDITDEKLIDMKIYDMSVKDAFTGLYNRNYFEKELDKFNDENLLNYGLVVCDLDGLKFINDTLGHNAGDKYLVMATEVITKAFDRGNSIISRTGGDEFVVLFRDISQDEIIAMIDRCKNLIKNINIDEDLIIPLSLSMGYAISPQTPRDIRELLKEADDYMYRNKLNNKQSSKSSVMKTLKKALLNKEPSSEDHCDRIEFLSIELAKAVGIEDKELADISLFAKFHDFGKVGISDDILFKPSRLTNEEIQEVRRHSEIGYRIAQSYTDISHISSWILHHHEWWDGTGYPIGLVGKDIPIQSRILSIADAYDAMTNDKPYRKALSKEMAIDEIKKGSGTQFDPELADKFIKIVLNLEHIN